VKLYSLDLSPFAARVRAAIYYKNLTVEYLVPPGGTASAEYAAINPMGRLPTLVLDDGSVLPESETIIEYLDDAFPTPPLRPRDAKDRAQVRLLARITACYIDAPLFMLFPQIPAASRDASLVSSQLQRLQNGLGFLSSFLTAGAYAFGGQPTTADCCVFPTLYLVRIIGTIFECPDILSGQPRIRAYYQQGQSDPVLARVLEEMQAGMKAAGHV
jgi:glutathione S-transferase